VRRPSSASRTLAVALVVAMAVATGVAVTPAGAQQGAPVSPPASPPASPVGPPEAGAIPTPLIGDFDGDGRADQLWYGPGSGPDHAWYGQGARSFSGRAVTVSGNYTPLVGDFNGDGRDDVLWYGPGSAADFLWQGTSGRGFVGRSLSIGGSYQPFVGDFDGDRRSDVFWFSPAGPDQVWYGTGAGFTGRQVSVTRPYLPVVGDFDANGTDDVLWYGPGTARDFFWRGTWSRTFLGVTLSVGKTYTPVVGDFGGDGHDDVYWHGSGATDDVVWRGRQGGAFEGSSTEPAGTTVPFAGDFDGDGADDLGWNDPGTAADRLWFGGSAGFTRRSVAVGGAYEPRVGDFDGDGRDDIFWFAGGDPRDVLWFAGAARGFSSRPSTLDPLPGPGIALRQSTLANQFNPYGYVAHAMGPTAADADSLGRQFGYSNSLEAFEHNYARGFRVFESDWVRLADGTVLSAHDGTESRYGLPPGVTFAEARREQLSGVYSAGGASGPPRHFTPLFAEDVPALLDAHPDLHLILDTKADHVAIARRFVQLTAGRADLLDRLMPHVADQSHLDQLRALYPIRNYVMALYRTQAFNRMDDDAVVDFVRRNRVPAVMMWFGTRNPALSLRDNMGEQRRYTPSFEARLRAAGAVTYVHSLKDTDTLRSFVDRGVGVYSNGPFPPFNTEVVPIEPNVGDAPLA